MSSDSILLIADPGREPVTVVYTGSDPASLRAAIDAAPIHPDTQVISWGGVTPEVWAQLTEPCEPAQAKAEPAWKREQRNRWRSRR